MRPHRLLPAIRPVTTASGLSTAATGGSPAAIHRRGPWRHRDAVENATLEWVDKRRLLERIGNVPPAEFEAAYYRQQDGSAMVA